MHTRYVHVHILKSKEIKKMNSSSVHWSRMVVQMKQEKEKKGRVKAEVKGPIQNETKEIAAPECL